jgi:U3 small nucleolar RNA-associated protein 12
MHTYSDTVLSKITDFVMIPELRLLVVGNAAQTQQDAMYLNLYEIVKSEDSSLELKSHSKVKKQSQQKVVEMHYHADQSLISVLSSDGKLEFFSINMDSSSLLKKMVRLEKRLNLKRAKNTSDETRDKLAEDDDAEQPKEVKMDKSKLKAKLQEKDYDLSIHLSSKAVFELETASKARSYAIIESSKKHAVKIYLAIGNKNQVLKVRFDMKKEDNQFKQQLSIGKTFGCHSGPVRGVVVSQNDYMMATYSFDSVMVWQIDFSFSTGTLTTVLKAQIDTVLNVLSLLILPGNRYLVMGTKEGEVVLYDLQEAQVIQTVEAHQKEVWELAMHTSPQIKDSQGQLLIASASADHTIKFWNLAQSQNSGKVKLQFYEKIESTDEVMGVKFTPDGKYFIFSLLD